MAENKNLREENAKAGELENEAYDVNYLRDKYNVTTHEIVESIRKLRSNNGIDIEDYLSAKTGIPKDEVF